MLNNNVKQIGIQRKLKPNLSNTSFYVRKRVSKLYQDMLLHISSGILPQIAADVHQKMGYAKRDIEYIGIRVE